MQVSCFIQLEDLFSLTKPKKCNCAKIELTILHISHYLLSFYQNKLSNVLRIIIKENIIIPIIL